MNQVPCSGQTWRTMGEGGCSLIIIASIIFVIVIILTHCLWSYQDDNDDVGGRSQDGAMGETQRRHNWRQNHR